MKLLKKILAFLKIEICFRPDIIMEQSSFKSEDVQYNPATGYTMSGAMDSGGNTLGTNSHSSNSYQDTFRNY